MNIWQRKLQQMGAGGCALCRKIRAAANQDHLWREHLLMLEHLRQVIGLRGYGQRDPLNEYKSEAFQLFEQMIKSSARSGHGKLMRVEFVSAPSPEEMEKLRPWKRAMSTVYGRR